MNDNNSNSDIFESTSIFDYVAESMSEPTKRQFENRMAQDEALRQKVEHEAGLRHLLEKASDAQAINPLSDGNFDHLMERIEKSEKNGLMHESKHSPNVHIVDWFRPKYVGIAASLFMISFISFNFWGDLSEPKFTTLSAPEQTTDFALLATQKRLAKFVLNNEPQTIVIEDLLTDHNLESLDPTVRQGTLIVKSKIPITQELIDAWRSDDRVSSVSIIEIGEQ